MRFIKPDVGDYTDPPGLKPGDKMSDGTVYAGMSPEETNHPLYTTPAMRR